MGWPYALRETPTDFEANSSVSINARKRQSTPENVHVTGSEITVGSGADSPKGIWGFLDDVELSQVSAE